MISDLRDQGRVLALLTKHGKTAQIAPALAPLGLRIETTEAFDTDALGTFTGEVERTLSPLDCARQKARLACELTGLSLGLGSEGSFGGGPLPGLMNWDNEVLVLYDAEREWDIVATASGPVSLRLYEGDDLTSLKETLTGAEPQQAWILKTAGEVHKGLADSDSLTALLDTLALIGPEGALRASVRIEPDLRAMHCPQRQQYIAQAAEQLARRLQALCPGCQAPDFWYRERVTGLPCGCCGTPTDLAKAYIRQCQHCHHQETEPTNDKVADPGRCHWCNP